MPSTRRREASTRSTVSYRSWIGSSTSTCPWARSARASTKDRAEVDGRDVGVDLILGDRSASEDSHEPSPCLTPIPPGPVPSTSTSKSVNEAGGSGRRLGLTGEDAADEAVAPG